MRLSAIDKDYINHRMDTYDIKYQEIYDEIKDHITSAIEVARERGDERNIVYVFDELMEAHFPGFWAFQKISKQYEKAYRAKLKRTLWSNFRHYLTWQVIGLIILFVIVGFYLPHSKITSLAMMIGMVVIAFATQIYSIRQSGKIKPNEGKKSMVKNHVTRYGFFLLMITNVILNLIGMVGRDYNIVYLNPRYFHPVFYILLLSFFVIYGLSSARLCRQELKIVGPVES